MGGILVKKGSIETRIRADRIDTYTSKGWSLVDMKPKQKPKTYESYTMQQLKDIAKNRNLYVNSRLRKQDIIDMLLNSDNMTVSKKPSNKGFTDNLIKE
jgi:response regulator RpfG family c-di-GMP phosphodiesterase